MIDYPNKLNIIFDKLLFNSIRPIIIGGYVRDFLLQKESKDIDIELYGINSFSKLEEILEEFGDVNSVGKSFGVCKLKVDDLDLDFSLPRSDSKIDKGHRGFEIQVDSSLDFKTATSRRDFTINAIGYDIQTKEILDPFNGQKDLKNRVLKAVNIDKFQEDPLRVLRAVQFSSRLNLSIDNELFIVCKRMIENSILDELPKERIFIEIQKLLLKSLTPSLGFKLLNFLGGFNYFTEFKSINMHNLEKTYKAIDTMSSLKTNNKKTNTILMLAALCYQLSADKYDSFLSKLSNDKNLFNRVSSLLKHQNDISFEQFDDYDIYLLATKVTIEEFVLFSIATSQTKREVENINDLKIRAEDLGVLHQKAEAIVQGKDIISLGIAPSKEFSTILSNAYIAQINGVFKTKEEAYSWLKRELFT